jgi:hypothetical protein
MKINFFTPKTKVKNIALIGKTGVIRINKEFAEKNKFIKNEYWLIGIDDLEKPLKSIYLFKTKEKDKGFKMHLINGHWSIDGSLILEKIKLNVPVKCKIETYELEELNGFILTII